MSPSRLPRARADADAFSDIDVWLRFPDQAVRDALRNRFDLYQAAGEVLLAHEAPPTRPPGGVYTLALYDTGSGPIQADWYLAPQRTSRAPRPATVLHEQVPVPHGDRLLDANARGEERLDERLSWLVCMLFIAIKEIARDGDLAFSIFLGQA